MHTYTNGFFGYLVLEVTAMIDWSYNLGTVLCKYMIVGVYGRAK